MNIDILFGFFNGKYGIDNLKEDIQEEVDAFVIDSKKNGGSSYFYFDVNAEYFIEEYGFIKLLDAYLTGFLSEKELEYIYQCFEMAGEEKVAHRIYNICNYLCDPVVGFPITKQNILIAKNYLLNNVDSLQLHK